jgi:hypothetical protein
VFCWWKALEIHTHNIPDTSQRHVSTGFPSKTVGRARKRDFWHEGKTFYHGHGKEENIVGNLSCVLFLHNTVFFFMKMQLP